MILSRFIGWVVLLTMLVAIAYSGFAYEVSPSVFWSWLGTLLATFISVFAAIGVGLILFNYQTSVTDERKRQELTRLAVTELHNIIHSLQPKAQASFKPARVHAPMVEEAARSGLFKPQTTANLMGFTWNAAQYNQLVLNYHTVLYSHGINPNAGTFLEVLVSMGRENSDTMIASATQMRDELLREYPDAFP
jgi:hypothetical protein